MHLLSHTQNNVTSKALSNFSTTQVAPAMLFPMMGKPALLWKTYVNPRGSGCSLYLLFLCSLKASLTLTYNSQLLQTFVNNSLA